MGISGSKVAPRIPENAILENQDLGNAIEEQESFPSTPILTPKIIRENIQKDTLDPRSPSKHIARTPIELLPSAAEKLKTLTLESANKEVSVETPLKSHLILGMDPRSPTFEFQRTPIVVSASPDKEFPVKIINKNLDKVLKCALPNTPRCKITPPKLLESCPVTPKPKSDAYKRKSFVLLETNVDFTETDLDNVIKEKHLGKSLQNLYVPGEISYTGIIDPRSPSTDFLRTPIQICQKIDDSDGNIVETIESLLVQSTHKYFAVNESNSLQTEETSVNVESLSPIIDIQTEPDIVVAKTEDCVVENIPTDNVNNQNLTESEDCEKFSIETDQQLISISVMVEEPLLDTCITETEEDITFTPCKKYSPTTARHKSVVSPILKHQPQIPKSAPVSPPSIVSVTPKKSKSQPVTPPFIDLTADVKELDKKLTHLIYEDEKDLVVCPRIVKVKDQNRTPLRLRNGSENKKSTQKLKVSDKPRKAEYAVSKIPVFKEKKIKVQCENTPPRGMRPRKSQWDVKDDTLVI